MHRCAALLFAAFICCAALSQTCGLVLSAKEKRGWTMNSAGYLLGPHAIDRIFNDKHGLAGKRDIQPEENIKAGTFGRQQMDDSVVRTVIEFLTYLHRKETGALDNISTTVSSEETDQS
ncbi:galanin peptides isoform X2 [Paroedura picta]|uniref:galanin peptides isoform X2 n=1 Tax=Paroedura picta TaxID=143630 RepID=UPI004055DBB4